MSRNIFNSHIHIYINFIYNCVVYDMYFYHDIIKYSYHQFKIILIHVITNCFFISGSLPTQIGNLNKLTLLYVQVNSFSGKILCIYYNIMINFTINLFTHYSKLSLYMIFLSWYHKLQYLPSKLIYFHNYFINITAIYLLFQDLFLQN